MVDCEYIPKWKHKDALNEANTYYGNNTGAMARITELEDKLERIKTFLKHEVI